MSSTSEPLVLAGDYLWSPASGSLVLVGPDRALRQSIAARCRATLDAYGWQVVDGPAGEHQVSWCQGDGPAPAGLLLASLDRRVAARPDWAVVCATALVLDCRDQQVTAVRSAAVG